MKILVIGGSQFVGYAIVEEAIRRGHEVTLFNRGKTAPAPTTGATVIIGDRNTDLSGLCDADNAWDATIDVCCYRPNQVDLLANALGGRGGKHVYVSTVSVYAGTTPPQSNEDNGELIDLTPVLDCDTSTVPINAKTYGPLKLLCEQRVNSLYSAAIIVRPTFVIGPLDYTMRFPKWVERIHNGGVIECPEPKDGPIQYIDVRDHAAFVLHVLEEDMSGAFNCLAPCTTFSAMLNEIIQTVGKSPTELQWISCDDDERAMREFPLWLPARQAGLMQLSNSKARSAGLVCRPLADTIRDTLAWIMQQQSK